MEKRTFEEWKKDLTEKCDAWLAAHQALSEAIDEREKLEDGDPDEIAAFGMVKMARIAAAVGGE